MNKPPERQITEPLQAWRREDEIALEKLTPQAYGELHRAAKGCIRAERDGHTLQTTALINELYLRLVDWEEINWQNRAHFFALYARQVRRIPTDQARACQSHERGGGVQPISLDQAPFVSEQSQPEVLQVDGALNAPTRVDLRKSQSGGVAFFPGSERRRDCRGSPGLAGYSRTRLAIGKGVAVARVEPGDAR